MSINASEQLRASAARLKAAGATGVKTAMVRQLRAAAKPVAADIQQSARDSLPRKGGMNTYVAAKKPTISVRTVGRQAGVRIKYSGPGRYSNQSGWRHPVFAPRGSKKKWATTDFPSAEGWWERGGEKSTPRALVQMRAVLDEVAAEIMRLGI